MIVNPDIKRMYREIASQSIHYNNTIDKPRAYNRRMLKVFKENLTEDEQLYLVSALFESLHYKNIVTDPDNVLQLCNIKLRTFTFIFFLVCLFTLLVSAIFKVNNGINEILGVIGNIFKLLSL